MSKYQRIVKKIKRYEEFVKFFSKRIIQLRKDLKKIKDSSEVVAIMRSVK